MKRSSPDPPNDYIELSKVQEIDYSPCEDCAYYENDNDIFYVGECQLHNCSVYGRDEACKYFIEG